MAIKLIEPTATRMNTYVVNERTIDAITGMAIFAVGAWLILTLVFHYLPAFVVITAWWEGFCTGAAYATAITVGAVHGWHYEN